MRSSRNKLRALVILTLLSGCAAAPSSGAVNVCRDIPLVSYTMAQQDQVAAEISAPGDAAVREWIKDYIDLRAAVRACQSVR